MKKPNLKSIVWDGKPISQPGLYSKIGIDVYHSADICVGPSVSSSGLRKLFAESPAHFFVEWPGNPNRIEPKEKAHFILGRATHHLFLGEAFFSKLFAAQPVEYPAKMRGASASEILKCLPEFIKGKLKGEMIPWANGANFCKAWHQFIQQQGRSVLTDNMIDNIRGMATSLSAHPIVKAGALNGMIERSIFWVDKETGLWIKARPDAIPTSSIDFVDLKSCQSVLWGDLVRSIGEFGYAQQGALIRTAAREVLGIDAPTFTLIFIEKDPPWCVRVVTLKDADLDRGEKQNRYALNAIARCLKSGRWPGPGGEREDAEHIELSDFIKKQIDDRLTLGLDT